MEEKKTHDLDKVTGAGGSGRSVYAWVQEDPERALKKLNKLRSDGVPFDQSSSQYKYYQQLKKALKSLGYSVE